LGLSVGAGRLIAMGFVVEDVGAPSASGLTLPRLYAGELVVRPLGTERLELAIGATHAEGDLWQWIVPRARVTAGLVEGLRLIATGVTLPRGTQLAFAAHADYQAELALAMDLDHWGVMGAGRAGFL